VHGNADALSRCPCAESFCNYCKKVEECEEINKEKIVGRISFLGDESMDWTKTQLEDPSIVEIFCGKEIDRRPLRQELIRGDSDAKNYWLQWDSLVIKEKILCRKWESPNLRSVVSQIVVPRKIVQRVLEEAHDSPTGNHFGVNKTLEKIQKHFYWSTCKQDVEHWCESCKICMASKGPSDKGKSSLQIFNAGIPFERVQMNILGPLLASTSGNKYLLVITDCFTKWMEAFPLGNIRAETIAEVFMNQMISRFGVPLELHTNQGRNFVKNVSRIGSNVRD